MPAASPTNVAAITRTISAPRSSTYIAAAAGDPVLAMDLYGWNARVSASLMLPAHFAEVSTRNAAAEILERVYGRNWPWNPTFERSLPSPQRGYAPRRDLVETRSRQPSTGKVIAELKFAFWERLFTRRHDIRLWDPHIAGAFPFAVAMPAADLRARIAGDLDAIRQLRNRIAHHEPVISRNLRDDLARMLDLIDLRSRPTADWVRAMEDATVTIAERP